jgi:hypothetical protein
VGTKHAGILEPALRTPPLSGTVCPDPQWAGARAVIVQGVEAMLGPRWVIMVNGSGYAPMAGPPLPPLTATLPPVEGAILYIDDLGTPQSPPIPPVIPPAVPAFFSGYFARHFFTPDYFGPGVAVTPARRRAPAYR